MLRFRQLDDNFKWKTVLFLVVVFSYIGKKCQSHEAISQALLLAFSQIILHLKYFVF